MMKKILIAFKVFAVAAAFLPLLLGITIPKTAVAAALTDQICQPDVSVSADGKTTTTSGDIPKCINNIYVVSLSVAGFAGVVLFVFAGYLYMIGTTASVAQAKKIMGSTVFGIVILLGAYMFLNTISPNLTSININLPTVKCDENGANCALPENASSTGNGTAGFSVVLTGFDPSSTMGLFKYDMTATLNGSKCTSTTCGKYKFAWSQDGAAIAACTQNWTCHLEVTSVYFQGKNNSSTVNYQAIDGNAKNYGSASLTITPTSKVGDAGGSGTVPPGSGTTASGSGGSTACHVVANSGSPASVANLQNTCFGSNAMVASAIANRESAGIASTVNKTTDVCDSTNGKVPVSIGLFQINITAWSLPGLDCPSAFNGMLTAAVIHGTAKCSLKSDAQSQSLYQQCVAALLNASQNISKACSMSNNGNNFAAAWGTPPQCSSN